MSSINSVLGSDALSSKLQTANVPEKVSGESFKNVLNSKKSSIGDAIKQTLEKVEGEWRQSFDESHQLMSSLPGQYKQMLEVQMSVSKVHLQTEIITKVGDSVQSSIKKIQQQG